MKQRWFIVLLAVMLALAVTVPAFAAEILAKPKNLAVEPVPVRDLKEANQLPTTGYFYSALDGAFVNREVRWYIPATAVLRPYFHFIAVPDKVDVDSWLVSSGWAQIADETGECLYLLLPNQTTGVWGNLADEKAYIDAAKAKHGGVGTYFTTFGVFYLEGYGAGAAPLEAWAAENPNLVIAQAFVNRASIGASALANLGSVSFGWAHMTDGDRNLIIDRQQALVQMATRLQDLVNKNNRDFEGLLEKDDMPVPTWLVNYNGVESLNYWKTVNKATAAAADITLTSFGGIAATGSVYNQKADTWATEFAGRISKVTAITINGDSTNTYAFNKELRNQLTDYSRYDVSISYGNALNYRLDYTAIQVERFASAKKEATGTVSAKVRNYAEPVKGQVTIKTLTLPTGYVMDVLLYVPETAGYRNIPVVTVWHGASQTSNLFMDSTMWWQVAAENGFAIFLQTRTASPGTGNLPSSTNQVMFAAMRDYLAADGRFDMSRIYATGQSAGGNATNSLAMDAVTNKQIAAAFPSNFPGSLGTDAASYQSMPIGLAIGEGNYSNRGIPGYATAADAKAAGADILWDSIGTDAAPTGMPKWINYYTTANSLDDDNLLPIIKYSGGNALNGGAKGNKVGDISDWNSSMARYRTFTWANDDGYPVMEYVFTLYEAHNNIAGHAEIMWDFMKHYSLDTKTGVRYYDNNALKGDMEAKNLAVEPSPVRDPKEGNQLSLSGYFYAALEGNFATREVRWYVPDTAVLRPYFHFIAVPDSVDVDKWIVTSGWKRIADETGECLYILLPDQATGKWGELEAEKAYIAAAKDKHGGVSGFFTTFGVFYLEGYGAGAAPLEAWAAENPHLVISQAFINGKSVGKSPLEALGAISYGFNHMGDGDRAAVSETDTRQRRLVQMAKRLEGVVNPNKADGTSGLLEKDDMPIPTWLVNYSAVDSLNYWKFVNKATDDTADGTVISFGGTAATGMVFKQKADTWATEYAGRISKVTTLNTVNTYSYSFNRQLRDELTDYSRYDVTISYGNALNYRLDYTDLQVKRYSSPDKMASGTVSGMTHDGPIKGEITFKALTIPSSGYVLDMLLYVPETAPDSKIPVVTIWHGASQTANLFMDSTMWWQVAAENGFALVSSTRTNAPGTGNMPTGHTNSDLFLAVLALLEADGRFDMNRVYATGQSAGSSLTASLAVANSDRLAAVFPSNAGTPSPFSGGLPIPSGVVIGEGNSGSQGIPGATAEQLANVKMYLAATVDAEGKPSGMAKWIAYYTDANGLNASNLSRYIKYSGSNALNGGTNTDIGTIAQWDDNGARFRTFTWTNSAGIPVMQFVMTLYEAHNNIAAHAGMMWEFMKHYSVDLKTGIRYYSNSVFEVNDSKVITRP